MTEHLKLEHARFSAGLRKSFPTWYESEEGGRMSLSMLTIGIVSLIIVVAAFTIFRDWR